MYVKQHQSCTKWNIEFFFAVFKVNIHFIFVMIRLYIRPTIVHLLDRDTSLALLIVFMFHNLIEMKFMPSTIGTFILLVNFCSKDIDRYHLNLMMVTELQIRYKD